MLKRIRKIAKNITRPIARPLERILKPIARPLRPVGARLGAFTGPGLFLQPQVLGIRNKKSQRMFTNTQRVSRIVAGTAVAVYAAPAALSAVGGLGITAGGAASSALSMAPSLLGGRGGGESPAINERPNENAPGGEWTDPADYGPGPNWPTRPETATPAAPGSSGLLALVGLGVGAYLLRRGG